MRWTRRILATVAVVASPIAYTAAVAQPAIAAPPPWAPAATAPIHPGVQTFTAGAQCTANFIFHDGTNVYIGQAAHCSGTGGSTATDGCTSGSLPLGTEVEVTGATRPGVMVYNSWLTMQALGETDANVCAFNDLALVRLHPDDVGRVNPSIPFWGGPVALDDDGTTALESVYSYGNSSLRLGIPQLSPKQGVSVGESGGGWSHGVFTLTPGVPGDSGSAFLDSDGEAVGVLSTLQLAPLPASNGVGDLPSELAYLHAHFSGAIQLATGTEAFNPNRLV